MPLFTTEAERQAFFAEMEAFNQKYLAGEFRSVGEMMAADPLIKLWRAQ